MLTSVQLQLQHTTVLYTVAINTHHTRILPVHTQTAERENDNEMKPDKPDAAHWDQYYLVITSL